MAACLLSRFSHVQLFATLQTVARQGLLFWGFSRQEYCSGLPFPSPGSFPNSGIEPMSLTLAGRFFTAKPRGKPVIYLYRIIVVYLKFKFNCT